MIWKIPFWDFFCFRRIQQIGSIPNFDYGVTFERNMLTQLLSKFNKFLCVFIRWIFTYVAFDGIIKPFENLLLDNILNKVFSLLLKLYNRSINFKQIHHFMWNFLIGMIFRVSIQSFVSKEDLHHFIR